MRHIQGFMSLWAATLLFFTLIVWMFNPRVSERALMADVGTIGTSAAVEANPLNTLAAELKVKSDDLNEREAALAEREGNSLAANTFFSYGLWGASGLLLLLLIVNLYLDLEVHDIRRRLGSPVPKP
jgi:hypothetical protein